MGQQIEAQSIGSDHRHSQAVHCQMSAAGRPLQHTPSNHVFTDTVTRYANVYILCFPGIELQLIDTKKKMIPTLMFSGGSVEPFLGPAGIFQKMTQNSMNNSFNSTENSDNILIRKETDRKQNKQNFTVRMCFEYFTSTISTWTFQE